MADANDAAGLPGAALRRWSLIILMRASNS